MTVEDVIARYGIVAIFLGSALEGEIVAVTGGLLAHRQLIPLWAATLATCTGSFLADQICFLAGRRFRDHSRMRSVEAKPAYTNALAALERNPTLFILSFRFFYGLRTITAVAIGTSRVPLAKFATLDALAAGLWGAIFTGLGYVFGRSVERLFGYHLSVEDIAIMAVVLAIVFAAVYVCRTRHHAHRQ
jgi:membrane protein DedA with SNARE-associated domain